MSMLTTREQSHFLSPHDAQQPALASEVDQHGQVRRFQAEQAAFCVHTGTAPLNRVHTVAFARAGLRLTSC